MKGLLRKDLYVLQRSMRLFLLILLFLFLPSVVMPIYALVYCTLLPSTAMAYDERSHWDSLAAMMPYSTEDIVLSKYLLGWMACCTTFVLALVIQGVLGFFFPRLYGGSGIFLSLFMAFCLALTALAITLPPMFRLGVERARYATTLILIAIACGSPWVIQFLTGAPAAPSGPITIMAPAVIACAATALSIPLSLRWYNRKNP